MPGLASGSMQRVRASRTLAVIEQARQTRTGPKHEEQYAGADPTLWLQASAHQTALNRDDSRMHGDADSVMHRRLNLLRLNIIAT